MQQRILVTRRLPRTLLSSLYNRPNTIITMHDSDEPMNRLDLLSEARRDGGCAGLLCLLSDRVDRELLDACGPNLKAIATLSVGFSHIDLSACKEKGIRVGYTPDVLTEATADLTLALLLSAARRVPEAVNAVKTGEWKSWTPFWMTGKSVGQSTVGIVGLGRIGVAVAKRLAGFGCRILYTGRSGAKPEFEASITGGATYCTLENLLSQSDYVVLLCASTPETRGLLSYERLMMMKSTACLVNVARGEIVDQDALIRILKERPNFLAALDVCTPEPLPLDNPLLTLKNALVLPHIGSATQECREEMCRISSDNIAAILNNTPMRAEVPM
jgi:glyoxylate/hydroxypyruvate reductase